MNTNKTVLHHYLGTGLKMISESGTKLTLHGLHDLSDDTINYILENEVLNSRYVELKPALHSMNRLTIPIENGEVPIVELGKIAFPESYHYPTKSKGEINGEECIKKIALTYSDGFQAKKNKSIVSVPNQLQLFQYLIKKHFNCFGLSESEYIEKSTLKTTL